MVGREDDGSDRGGRYRTRKGGARFDMVAVSDKLSYSDGWLMLPADRLLSGWTLITVRERKRTAPCCCFGSGSPPPRQSKVRSKGIFPFNITLHRYYSLVHLPYRSLGPRTRFLDLRKALSRRSTSDANDHAPQEAVLGQTAQSPTTRQASAQTGRRRRWDLCSGIRQHESQDAIKNRASTFVSTTAIWPGGRNVD